MGGTAFVGTSHDIPDTFDANSDPAQIISCLLERAAWS